MLKIKWVIAWLLLISFSFSSCGIFGKGCGCPHFGKAGVNNMQMGKYADVQINKHGNNLLIPVFKT